MIKLVKFLRETDPWDSNLQRVDGVWCFCNNGEEYFIKKISHWFSPNTFVVMTIDSVDCAAVSPSPGKVWYKRCSIEYPTEREAIEGLIAIGKESSVDSEQLADLGVGEDR